MIYETLRAIRSKTYLRMIPLLGLLVFLPLEILLRPGWDPYQGRYFAPLVALAAPLAGTWFDAKKRRVVKLLVVALALVVATVTALYNPAKPTLGKLADELHVWSNERVFVQTISWNRERALYERIEKSVPHDATLGYYTPVYMLTYPMFGEYFTRTLVPIQFPRQVSYAKWLQSQNIDYLLVYQTARPPNPPAIFEWVGTINQWKLYKKTRTP
jgi:hypothetical protein